MTDGFDTDRMAVSADTDRSAVSAFEDTDPRRTVLALEDTAPIVLEQAFDDTFDADLADTVRVMTPRARTQPEWPPEPPLPQSRSRRHKAVYAVVVQPKTSADS